MKTELTVNRSIIDNWVNENAPDGLAKLALLSRITTHSLVRIRSGKAPSSVHKREGLAAALEVPVDDLFPAAIAKKKRSAS